MADKELNVRIKLKRDTDANWRAKDPQLLAGEVVFVDTNAGEVRTKVGDGTKKYSALPFSDEAVRNLISDNSKPAFYFQGTVSGLTFTPTSTVADLISAYEAGRPCYCTVPRTINQVSTTTILPLVAFSKDSTYLFADNLDRSNGLILQQVRSVDGGTSWTYSSTFLASTYDIPTNISAFTNDAGYLTSTTASTTYVGKTGDEEIKGIKTFESVIKDSAVPTDNTHLTNKKYVDEKIASAVQEATSGGMTETVGNTKYLRLDGTNSPTAGINFNGQNLEGVNLLAASDTLSNLFVPCGTDYLGTDTFMINDTGVPFIDLELYTCDTDGNFHLKDENDTANNYKYTLYGGSYAFDDDDAVVELGEGPYINSNVFNAMPHSLNMEGKVIAQASAVWIGSNEYRSGQEFVISSKDGGLKLNAIDVNAQAVGGNYNNVLDNLTTDQVRLINIATPTTDTDAVNKKYVDDAIPTIPTSLRNPYALTVKGAVSATYDGSSAVSITIPNAGISQTEADGRYLKLSGGTMTGTVNVNNQSLTSVGKLSFLRGVYLQNSNIQQANVLSILTSTGTPAYISAYVNTPLADDNDNIIANKAYVNTKTQVILKTWTSADVS